MSEQAYSCFGSGVHAPGIVCDACRTQHFWTRGTQPWEFCRRCGIVKRGDGLPNKPCPGSVRITFRAEGA